MTCLTTKDGYSITPEPQRNRIVINLPQTVATATNTMWPTEDRKSELSDSELALILQMVRSLFKEENARDKTYM